MESQLERLLKKLHSGSFSDPKDICQSLREVVLDEDLTPELVAFASSKLFNSDIDLLKFAQQSIKQKDKLADETRRHTYLLIGDYIKLRKENLMDYLVFIFTKAQSFFMREESNKAKEAVLRIITKIVKHINNLEYLEEIIKPKAFCDYLLMHLKSYKPVPTVKGFIWHLIGLLYNRFPSALDTKTKKEVQEICLKQVEKLVETDKNTTAIGRMLKCLNETLHENYLQTEVLKKLFNYISVLMLPFKDTYEVPRSALKILATHANLLHNNILASAKSLFGSCIELMSHKNKDLKERASEAMQAITIQIAKGIYDEPQKYQQLYNYIMTTFWELIKQQTFIVNSKDEPTKKFQSAGKMVSIIKTVGFFSRVIAVISGKDQLRLFFHKLLDICDKRMVKSFESQDTHRLEGRWMAAHAKSMKSILYGHKQIFSFIGSFARIIEHVDDISYSEAESLEGLFILAVKQYAYYYEKYIPSLLEAMVSLIISFSSHSQLFGKWLKRTIMNSLKESLDSSRFMIAVDEDYFFMVRKACQMWSGIVRQSQWTGTSLNHFTGVFFDAIEHLLKNLDVSYKSVVEDSDNPAQNEIINVFSKSSERLVPANISDFQYMASLVLVFDHMLELIDTELYVDRVFGLYTDILRRFMALPKSISLMKVCRTLNDFINRNKYFDRVSQSKRNELVSCIKDLFNELYESLIKYQGDVLFQALKVLMSTPIEVIYMNVFKILKHQLPSVLLKSLDLGQEVPSLAFSALRCLEFLFTSTERRRVEKALSSVIPDFQKYLSVKDNLSTKQSMVGLFLREHNISKNTIMTETLRFLGRMGGLIHSVVPDLKNQEQKTKLQSDTYALVGRVADESTNFISWDHDCTLTFPLPLINRKVDLKVTKLLPRIMQLMLNSPSDTIKTMSCEFMHAVIIYIIGRSASDPKRNMSEAEMAEQNSFKERCSRIYSKILPAVFKVSCNKEHPSHQLMHTLSIQLIHFLSKTQQPNSPDIVVLLNILLEMLSQSKDISQFATRCLAELVKWNIKQQIEGTKQFPLIKMVVRNLWSLTASKNVKEGTVSLMVEILKIIHKEEALMTRYILEFCSLVLTISRNNKPVEPNLLYLTEKLVLSMKPYVKMLMIEHPSTRTGRFSSITTLLEWLYECGIFSNFSQQRTISYILWEKILTNYSTFLGTEIKEFLYQRARKDTKTLFQRIEQLYFSSADGLMIGCSTLIGYTDLWSTIVAKGYFELNRLIMFKDFSELYLNSIVSFLQLLLSMQKSRHLLHDIQLLNEQTQQITLECFTKSTQLLSSLLINTDVADSITEKLLAKMGSSEMKQLLIAMMLKPHEVIRTVNSDLILMRYPGYFRNCSNILEKVAQGNLLACLRQQYNELFGYEQGSVPLMEYIICQANLYDSQLLVFLRGHSEIDRILNLNRQDHFIEEELVKVIQMVESTIIQSRKDLSGQRCLMLLKFVLEHNHIKPIETYVQRQVVRNSPLFQKYEKYFLSYLVTNWKQTGKNLLNYAVYTIGLMKVLLSLSRLLSQQQLRNFFEWLPEHPVADSTSTDLLEELVKFNFVLISGTKIVLSHDYLAYVHQLLKTAMKPSNNLTLHECSMNLLSEMLTNETFKSNYLREFKEYIKALRHIYLPLRISDLKDQRSKSEFTTFLKTFRNMLLISQQITLFDTVFNILREKVQGYYEGKIRDCIDEFVSVSFTKKDTETQKRFIGWAFDCFFDDQLDASFYENARIAVAEKILRRLLRNCSEITAIQMMDEYLPRLLSIIKAPSSTFSPIINVDTICYQLLTKRTAYMLIEEIYKRVPPKSKAPEKVHQKEHHKQLIKIAHDTVKRKCQYEDMLKDHDTKGTNGKITLPILREYLCAAYNCLIVLFINTQSKKEHFKAYLFDKKQGQVLWDQIIDASKQNLGFEVETRFEIMKPIEPLNKPISSRIKTRYCDSSLFTIEEEFVPKTVQPQYEPPIQQPTMKVEVQQQKEGNVIQQQPVLELDIINQHPCMVNLLTVIDHMHTYFSDGGMPQWMESIYEELTSETLPIAVRVFLIKLILNRPNIFTQEIWMTELLKYLGLKDNGSKAFHYFYRDVTKQVLDYHKMGYKSEGRLSSTAVNKMIRMLPHENGDLFTYNVELFEGMLKFDKVFIDEKVVMQMLKFEEGKPEYLQWRLTGIIVVKSAIATKTPILQSYEDLIKATNKEERLRFFYKVSEVQTIRLIERMFEETKKKYSIAAAGLFGELLRFLAQNPQQNTREKLSEYLAIQISSTTDSKNRSCRERVPTIVHQIIQFYPPFLQQPRIASILENTLHHTVKEDRAFAIDSYRYLCEHLQKKRIPFNEMLFSLSMLLRSTIPKLVTDGMEVHRSLIALLGLLSDFTLLMDKNIYNMFYYVFEELDRAYSMSSQELDALSFFQLIIRLDDYLADNKMQDDIYSDFIRKVKKTLISGLASQHKSVNQLVFGHFQNNKREHQSPAEKLLSLCQSLYVPEFEELWLTSTVPLLMSLAKKSSDYDRLLFEESLDKLANYYDWDFRHNFKDNASQPYTPAHTLMTQALKQNGLASIIASQSQSSSEHLEGMLRASQNSYLMDSSPIFTVNSNHQIFSQASEASHPSQESAASDGVVNGSSSKPTLMNIFKRTGGRKKPDEMSQFLASNAISYNKMTVVGNNKVRFMNQKTDGSTDMQQAINKQTELYLKRVNERSQRGVLVRKYKVGELPDIQICGRDLIDPLMLLAFSDTELSGELFGLLFECICQTDSRESVKQFKNLLPDLLSRSQKLNFSFVSTLQKSLITLMKEMKEKIDFRMLSIAQRSNSYEYSVLFVQENLIQMVDDQTSLEVRKNLPGVNMQSTEQQFECWIDLMELYHHLYETDQVQGVQLKVMSSKQRERMTQIFNSKSKGLVHDAKKNLEQMLGVCQNQRLKKFIQDQKIDCDTLLSNWQEINKELKSKRTPLNDLENRLLITSLISTSKTSDEIAEMRIVSSNLKLDKLFYQQAVLSLACKTDIDRAKYLTYEEQKYFLSEWAKLSSFAIRSKHQLLQVVQKNYQLKEFLRMYSNINLDVSDCKALFGTWTQRSPSAIHDGHLSWMQLLEARLLYSRLMEERFGVAHDLITAAATDWYVQIGVGMVKKGLLGGAQTLMKKAILGKRGSKVFPWDFYKSTAKLKLKQLMVQLQPDIVENALHDFQQTPTIIRREMQKFEQVSEETKMYMNLMQVKFYEAFLDKHFTNIADIKCPAYFVNLYSSTIDKAFSLLRKICVSDLVKRDNNENLKLKRKTYVTLTCFTERLLTLLEEPFEVKSVKEAMAGNNLTVENISRMFAQSLIKSLQLVGIGREGKAGDGRQQSSADYLSSLILKLLKVVQKHSNILGDVFVEAIEEKKIPVWLFLYFLPQTISVLSLECSRYFEELFMSICRLYPEALIYQFNSQFQRRYSCKTQTSRRIYDELHQKHPTHFLLIEALDNLTHPELRLKDSLVRLREKDTQNDAILELDEMITNNQYYGKYNKKYIQERSKKINRIINMFKANDRGWVNEVDEMLKSQELKNPNIPRGFLTLSDFSVFFDEYASNEWPRIMLPGQFNTCGQQPIPQSKITIQSFDQSILALNSLRRPKRLTLYGNNEKKYMFLIKGGEDLRLDQRIEQLFGVINRIMDKNCECQKRELFLRRFEVTPMKRWMGLLQWVDNTQVLRDFVEKQYKQFRDPKGDLFTKNKSFEARMKFLETLSGQKDRINKHKPLMVCDEKEIVANFKKCEYLMPYGLLRRALQRLSKNYESYLHLKNRFICNFAVASVACYLLGIGDRHLDNFLVHVPTATIILIDFGYSFGASLDLPLPELVPFRLTKIFRELMDPIGVNGIFKASMVYSISALRNKWHQLIDFCDVFINDPVLDWTYIARKKRLVRSAVGNGTASMSQELSEDQTFFKKKIEYVQSKLQGKNPRMLLAYAINESKHREVPGLKKIIEGNKPLKSHVSAAEQVELLIELATDKNILGRAFTPWCPYV